MGNIAGLIKSLEADIEAVKAEESRLAARRRTTENKTKWLKDYIKASMDEAGLDKIKTPLFSFSVQNNPPAVIIESPSALPKEYIVETISQVPDKRAIGEALKAGMVVPGARLETGRRLQIR
jgi:hypothetical protein